MAQLRYHALGDTPTALRHAEHARRLLCADAPGGAFCRDATAMVREISSAAGPEAFAAGPSSA